MYKKKLTSSWYSYFQDLVRQLIDSKNSHLANIPFKNLEKNLMSWKKFPRFVTRIHLRYNQKSQRKVESCGDQTDGCLEKFHSVDVNFNILQVAIITGKNHILEMLINHNEDPASIDDYVEYVSNPMTCSEHLVRSSISVTNALHLAAKFNSEALFIILKKANLDSEQAKRDFWEKASKKSGYSPLHNVGLNAVSTRYECL